MEELSMLDLKSRFYANFYPYIQFLRSVGLRLGQNIKIWFQTVYWTSAHGIKALSAATQGYIEAFKSDIRLCRVMQDPSKTEFD